MVSDSFNVSILSLFSVLLKKWQKIEYILYELKKVFFIFQNNPSLFEDFQHKKKYSTSQTTETRTDLKRSVGRAISKSR